LASTLSNQPKTAYPTTTAQTTERMTSASGIQAKTTLYPTTIAQITDMASVSLYFQAATSSTSTTL